MDEDVQYEAGLRPRTLNDYIGQDRVRENLQVSIAAARGRGEALDHVLLYGPPGLGKTTLAGVIANELGVNIRPTAGPVIEKPGDLAAMLTTLQEREVLFIDGTPEQIWKALTNGGFTKQYWAGRDITSDWKVGSSVTFKVDDSDDVETSGEVLEYDEPKRLSYTWKTADAAASLAPSTVVFELKPWGESVQLTVIHGPLPADSQARDGWVAIMSSLKTFVETGNALAATKLWPRRNAHPPKVGEGAWR